MVLSHQIINYEKFKSDICDYGNRVFINRCRIILSADEERRK